MIISTDCVLCQMEAVEHPAWPVSSDVWQKTGSKNKSLQPSQKHSRPRQSLGNVMHMYMTPIWKQWSKCEMCCQQHCHLHTDKYRQVIEKSKSVCVLYCKKSGIDVIFLWLTIHSIGLYTKRKVKINLI